MNKKQIILTMVAVCSTAAIAFLGRKVYLTYKEVYKDVEDLEDVVLEKETTSTIEKFESKVIEDIEEDTEVYEDERTEFQLIADGEGDVLRHEPNSGEALEQYTLMRLADLAHNKDAYWVTYNLFEYKYEPITKADKLIKEYILNERILFFGADSIHASDKEVTFAEFVLHYVELLEFDCGGGIAEWANYILKQLGISMSTDGAVINDILSKLMRHRFATDGGFGLFGLKGENYIEFLETTNNSPNNMSFREQYNIFTYSYINELSEWEEDEEFYDGP